MKKILSLALVLVIALHFAGCGQKPSNHGEKSVEAEITNIETGIYWVQIDGEDVKVPITMMHPGKEPQVGDTIRIVYTGEISKEKPAIIEDVLKIYLVEDAAPVADDTVPTIDNPNGNIERTKEPETYPPTNIVPGVELDEPVEID